MMSTLSLGWLGYVHKKCDIQIGLKLWTSMQCGGINSVPVFVSLLPIALNVQSDNCWSANNGCKGQTFCNSRPHYRTAIMEPLTLFLVQHFKWIIRLRSRFLSHLDNFATQIHVFIWQVLIWDKVMPPSVCFKSSFQTISLSFESAWKCDKHEIEDIQMKLWIKLGHKSDLNQNPCNLTMCL